MWEMVGLGHPVLTSGVPDQMSLRWSQMALAADMALDSFLALMTAAPRCWTVWIRNNRNVRDLIIIHCICLATLRTPNLTVQY